MKKITFFTVDAYPAGGTERVMIMIANELSKYYEVEIVSCKKSSEKPFYDIDKNIKIINLNVEIHHPLTLYYRFTNLVLRWKLRKYKTDVFICAGIRYVPMTIFFRKKAKYIAWDHYTSFNYKKGAITDLGRKFAAKYADKIVVLTKKDRLNNIKLYGTDENKIVQIYNANENKALSNKYDVDSKSIISVGRFVSQKGFDYLVDVAEIVFSKHSDWKWHIYGEGILFSEISSKIKEKGLENNVVLKGLCNNMYDQYKNYSFYVLTSRYEGLGMVIVEAQNAKLPVISFNCNCGPDELILDEKNGYLVDCFDIDKMAEKIIYLIEHSEKRLEMSNNSMLDKEKLELNTIVEEWKKIL